jgi:hypothetical protein
VRRGQHLQHGRLQLGLPQRLKGRLMLRLGDGGVQTHVVLRIGLNPHDGVAVFLIFESSFSIW